MLDVYYIKDNMQITLIAQNVGGLGSNKLVTHKCQRRFYAISP
jgi:hypothetical protein